MTAPKYHSTRTDVWPEIHVLLLLPWISGLEGRPGRRVPFRFINRPSLPQGAGGYGRAIWCIRDAIPWSRKLGMCVRGRGAEDGTQMILGMGSLAVKDSILCVLGLLFDWSCDSDDVGII